MSTIINATTTNGVVIQPDNSGSLVLQTNNGTTALTIDTSQRAAFVAGTAALPAITTTGDTNTGIWFPAADTIAFAEGGTESMRIDSSGRVTMPYQPAFFAKKTNGSALSPVNPVLFNDVVTNIGSYYNASTGRFTAPVAGTYYFISTAHCETTNNLDRKIIFYVNGSVIAEAYVLNATGARTRIVNTAILVLSVNDYVTVGTGGTSDLWAGDISGVNFTGHLIG